MAIFYSWDVSTVDAYPTHNSQSDVIYNVHWRLKATDDANNDAEGNPQAAEVYGEQSLDVSDLSNFTDFADLTASDVQGWVETALGADKVAEMKAKLDAQIDKQVTPISVTKTIGE